MKNNLFHKTKKNVIKRTALFHIFINLFNVWINDTQRDSHVCFCAQSVEICMLC